MGCLLKEVVMFSVLKMLKKGAIALGCFLGPALVGILIKLIPGMNNMTVGVMIIDIIDKIIPGLPALSIGAALIMLINFLKNRK